MCLSYGFHILITLEPYKVEKALNTFEKWKHEVRKCSVSEPEVWPKLVSKQDWDPRFPPICRLLLPHLYTPTLADPAPSGNRSIPGTSRKCGGFLTGMNCKTLAFSVQGCPAGCLGVLDSTGSQAISQRWCHGGGESPNPRRFATRERGVRGVASCPVPSHNSEIVAGTFMLWQKRCPSRKELHFSPAYMLLSEVANTIFRNYCIKKIHTVPFESFSDSIMILFHLDLHSETF